MIVLMTLFGASAALPGQAQQDSWTRCKSDNPEQSIGGCSALIQSGQEPNIKLAEAFYGRGRPTRARATTIMPFRTSMRR